MSREVQHPFMDDYESSEGPNIDPAWLGAAVCRTIANAEETFLPTNNKLLRTDIPICDSCPAKPSCTMDSLAQGDYPKQGRRAGLLSKNRIRVDKDVLRLFNDDLDTMRYAPEDGYNSQTREEFYATDPIAPELVAESIAFADEVSRHFKSGGALEDRPEWPTPRVVEILTKVR